MMWKKAFLLLTVVIVIILAIISVRPASVQVHELKERISFDTAGSTEIPLARPFRINGLALSGSWEGPGYAQVWLVGENKEYLALDTRKLLRTIELSAFGTQFESVCFESCRISPMSSEKLVIIVSGPGVLSLDSLHFAIPLTPSGLAQCPNCQRIQQVDSPDHSLFLAVMLLSISIFGAHSCTHWCKTQFSKRVLLGVFVIGFFTLTGVFGVSVAAPTATMAVTAKQTASVLAALSVIVIFVMMAFEMRAGKPPEQQKASVWKDLEDAEEEWSKK